MATATEELRGPKLLATAVNKVLENPECWDQKTWHCGTKHCIGGWCQILGGRRESEAGVMGDVIELLGISRADAEWLCSATRTIAELHGYASALLDPDSFDRDGFNRDGFNRAGFDRDGKKLEPIVF